MWRLGWATLVLAVSFVSLGQAQTGPVLVGRAALVESQVSARLAAAEPRVVAIDTTLFFSEVIETGANARTILQFRDGSTLELGPQSSITIDRFVFNPAESTSEKALTVSRGVFRYTSAFVARSNDTQIRTPTATMGIRGSTVSGFYFPGLPLFVQVPNGTMTLTAANGASTTVTSGGSVAFAPGTSAPVSNLPPAVVAQALQQVSNVLGVAVPSLPPPPPQVGAQLAAANLIPTGAQRSGQLALPPPAIVQQSTVPVNVPLLVQAQANGLLAAGGSPRNAEQANFVNQANAGNPNAAAQIASYNAVNRAQNDQSARTGTLVVVTQIAAIAQPAVLMQIVTAAMNANASLAAQIVATAIAINPGARNQVVAAAIAANPGLAQVIQQAAQQALPNNNPPPGPGRERSGSNN